MYRLSAVRPWLKENRLSWHRPQAGFYLSAACAYTALLPIKSNWYRSSREIYTSAQIIQHGIVDVADMDCDFFVFSGHKIYGPNGIGVLYGKEKWLNEIPPYQGGGD